MSRPARHPIEHARKILAEGIPFGPRVHPCVCGQGRHAHAGDKATGACPETGCRKYRPDQAWELAYRAQDAQRMSLGQALRAADRVIGEKRRAANPVLPGQWRIGISDLDTCRRVIFYRNLPPEDLVYAWEDKREAMVGTIIHEGVEARLKMLYPWREFEQNVTLPGLDRDSRFDSYDPVTCQVQDTKTAGDWRWDKLGEEGPTEENWDKVYAYGLAVIERGQPVETVRLDYIKRSNGHDESFTRPYDQKRAEAARDRLIGHASALDVIAENPGDTALLDAMLPRDGDGPDRDPLCKRCAFRIHCWSIPQAEAVGRSPYSYTLLGPSPEDEAIMWAIEQKLEATRLTREAKDKTEETKDLLKGIEPGRYGGFEGYRKRGSSVPSKDDWVRYSEKIREWAALPPDERPPFDSIPLPQNSDYYYVQWGNVRKATLAAEAKAARTEVA